jgi:hypothetical protein
MGLLVNRKRRSARHASQVIAENPAIASPLALNN